MRNLAKAPTPLRHMQRAAHPLAVPACFEAGQKPPVK